MIAMLMLILAVLSVSLGSVSALEINGTDSYSFDDNSQIIEINEEDFLNTDENDVFDLGITPDVVISDNIDGAETKNITKGTSVTINVQATANFNYHYDSKVATLYVNGNSIKSTNLLPYNYDDNDRRGSFDYTFENDGAYEVKVVLAAYNGYSQSYDEATSNIITYIIGNVSSASHANSSEIINNGTNPQTPANASAKITVWDRNYPNNSTIYSNGDYVSDIAYVLEKSGDGFSDENLEVYINGQSIGRTTPNASNRLGNLEFDEDNDWTFYVVYSASVNDKTIAVTSNSLTFITRNTSNGVSNATNSTGDVNNTDDSGNASSTGNVNNTDDSGNASSTGNVNNTDDLVNDGEIKLLIRDANNPNNSTIILNEKYNVLLEYYVIVPSGDLLRNEIVLMCNDNSIATISTPADKTFTSVGGSVFINETGTYVFSAKYYYYEFLGNNLNGEVNSNVITYKLTVANVTDDNNPAQENNNTEPVNISNETNPSGDDVNTSSDNNSSAGNITPMNETNSSGGNTSPSDSNNGTNSSGGNTSPVDTNNGSNITGETKYSIDASDLIRGYNSPFDYKATFYDKNGNPLKNTEVLFVINGNDYNILTDEYGVAKIINSLSVGNFEVTILNPATGDKLTRNVTIVERITGNKQITMDYSYSSKYKIRLYADNGNPVGAGESVLITVKNIKYVGVSDADGYAEVLIKNNKLIPKSYTITAEYKGVKVTNKVVVKQILKSKNAKFKKSAKTKKFTATLKTSAGKAIKNKKITFKVNGKTYTAKTNSKGIATIKITNLKKVGKYSVKVIYLKTSIKKTIYLKK